MFPCVNEEVGAEKMPGGGLSNVLEEKGDMPEVFPRVGEVSDLWVLAVGLLPVGDVEL